MFTTQDIIAAILVGLVVGAAIGALVYEWFGTKPVRRRLESDRDRFMRAVSAQHRGTPYIDRRRPW